MSGLASFDAADPKFYVNGKPAKATGKQNLSLNDFLRHHTPFKGTKLACGEGGCGACAVQVARYDAVTDSVHTSSINSCLCPVGSLDGASITTVEGLGNSKSGFSSVQEKFASHHASQCGFCTPGFVVACHTTLARCQEAGEAPTPAAMMQGLDGNLCRCTGYMPILDACKGLVSDMEDLCTKPTQPAGFPEELKAYVKGKHATGNTEKAQQVSPSPNQEEPSWIDVQSLDETFAALSDPKLEGAMVLAGNTASGVYHEWPQAPTIVSIRHLPELTATKRSKDGLEFGAAVPFAHIIGELRKSVDGKGPPQAWLNMAAHIERIAGSHVRWAATPGGNLALLRNPKYYLESDFATVLMGAGGRVQISSKEGSQWLAVDEYLAASLQLGKLQLITAVSFPAYAAGERFWSHKVAQRYYNSHALVNMAISTQQDRSGALLSATLAVGCPTLIRDGCGSEAKVAWQLRRGRAAESALLSGGLTPESLADALDALQKDICPGGTTDASAAFYRAVAEGLAFQGLSPLVAARAEAQVSRLHGLLEGAGLPPPGVPSGHQGYQKAPSHQLPVGLPVEKDRIRLQASGEAVYSSDVGVGGGDLLYACVVPSTEALAAIDSIDPSAALQVPGVVAFVGADDIPGENRVYLGSADAEIFATSKASYVYEPLGLVVAESARLASLAAGLVKVAYSHPKDLGSPVFTIKDAIAADAYYEIPDGAGGKVHRGDVPSAMAAAKHVIKNARYTIPSQQHFYMETQAAVAQPQEDGGFLIHSSTQTLDGVQAAVSRALGIPASNVIAVCRRAGGGFGGKVARSMPVAAAAAVAAHKTGQAVHYQLSRNDDMRMNGGRSETELEYDVGFDGDGRISALSVRGWFLAGADLDLAWNDMFIIQTGADQVYDIPNIDLDLKVVRTNLPPRTIMRGPGFMDAAMLIEQVLEHVAGSLGADPAAVRRLNFLQAPQEGPQQSSPQPPAKGAASGEQAERGAVKLLKRVAGVCARALPHIGAAARVGKEASMMKTTLSRPFSVDCWTLPRIWEGLLGMADYEKRAAAVQTFNKQHAWRKRGISINPCRFDSAPQPMSAQVNVYYDGSILVTHGGLEAGQGLSTKVKQMAAYELGKLLPEGLRPLPMDLIRVNDTRSDIVPNSGPSWSSTASESACAAVKQACEQLVASLAAAAAEVKEGEAAAFWKAAVAAVVPDVGYAPGAVQLSAIGFFDGTALGGPEAGKEPMAYSAFGAAVSEVEIDVLTGEKRVLRSDIHFDCGQSLNPAVDMGQVEGAFIQGLGYLTSEEVVYDEKTGHLITDGTWTYKPPAASCIPQQLFVEFLKDSPNPKGVLSSKASGEPSLLLTTSVLYALRQAILAARTDLSDSAKQDFFSLEAPVTTVKLKQACGDFSVAALLRAAAEQESSTSSDGSWVKVTQKPLGASS